MTGQAPHNLSDQFTTRIERRSSGADPEKSERGGRKAFLARAVLAPYPKNINILGVGVQCHEKDGYLQNNSKNFREKRGAEKEKIIDFLNSREVSVRYCTILLLYCSCFVLTDLTVTSVHLSLLMLYNAIRIVVHGIIHTW